MTNNSHVRQIALFRAYECSGSNKINNNIVQSTVNYHYVSLLLSVRATKTGPSIVLRLNYVNVHQSELMDIAASKGNEVLGMIRRNITYKDKSLIVPLYKAIVRPHLEYCIQAWSPYLRKDIDMLEKIQRRATKLIPGLRDLRYEERLKECGLTTLETRRLGGDQIEVFKILNGYENIDSNIFFEIKEGKITRGHNYTLVKKQSTVKPLYSEQSRDQKKCSLYRGVHLRGVIYVHVHMCLQYNVHILKRFRPC